METHLILSAVQAILLLLSGGPDKAEPTNTEPTEAVGSVTVDGQPAPDGIGEIGDITNQAVTDSMTFETIRRGNNK